MQLFQSSFTNQRIPFVAVLAIMQAMKRSVVILLLVMAAAGIGSTALYFSRPKASPAQTLYQDLIPRWQATRFQEGSSKGDAAAQAVFAGASHWPSLQQQLRRIDDAWPAEQPVREATEAANQSATTAGLPYFLDVQPIRERPILLTYSVVKRTGWHAGATAITALRVRRLDSLNIELAMLGETQHGQPRVLLDRIEANLSVELQRMYRPAKPSSTSVEKQGLDDAALLKLRAHLESQIGAKTLSAAVAKLTAREALLESMRSRFHAGSVQLARPDGFVLGEAWVQSMEPYTQLGRPGGPLMLDSDLRQVARTDEELRAGPLADALHKAVDVIAAATDVHEIRHAIDVDPPAAPAQLQGFFSQRDERFPRMAGLELRAYLSELSYGPLPPCVTIAKLLRSVYGESARRTPHFYASYVITRLLAGKPLDSRAEPPTDAVALLDQLCNIPEPTLRRQSTELWQTLYGDVLVQPRQDAN